MIDSSDGIDDVGDELGDPELLPGCVCVFCGYEPCELLVYDQDVDGVDETKVCVSCKRCGATGPCVYEESVGAKGYALMLWYMGFARMEAVKVETMKN